MDDQLDKIDKDFQFLVNVKMQFRPYSWVDEDNNEIKTLKQQNFKSLFMSKVEAEIENWLADNDILEDMESEFHLDMETHDSYKDLMKISGSINHLSCAICGNPCEKIGETNRMGRMKSYCCKCLKKVVNIDEKPKYDFPTYKWCPTCRFRSDELKEAAEKKPIIAYSIRSHKHYLVKDYFYKGKGLIVAIVKEQINDYSPDKYKEVVFNGYGNYFKYSKEPYPPKKE